MKLFVAGEVTSHADGRPFFDGALDRPFVPVTLVDNPAEADRIFCPGYDSNHLMDRALLREHGRKFVWWFNDDRPTLAYALPGTKFVAQRRCMRPGP
jgi:hypothetical protein